ncbi:MAG TPA: hypothetical protein PK855_06625 [Bacteroidales bacterium]|nr:hypothetical protein [Bacteroidales bacterium]
MKHLNFSGILILLAILISGEVSLSQTCATCPGNTVTGVSASAFGAGNTSSGNYSFVAGRNSTANQSYATVIGSNSRASGGHSYVVGSSSFANGNFSYVFGGNSITPWSDYYHNKSKWPYHQHNCQCCRLGGANQR